MQVRQLLMEGHPTIESLCLAIADWSQERRILEAQSEVKNEPSES